MKKFLLLFVLSLSIHSFSQNKLKTGFYYIAVTEAGAELIKDTDDKVYAIEKNPIVGTADFLKAKIVSMDSRPDPKNAIEIKLSNSGRKKWENAKKRAAQTGESIMFICNDRIYLEKRFLGSSNHKTPIIDLLVDEQHLERIFDQIKSEIASARGLQ